MSTGANFWVAPIRRDLFGALYAFFLFVAGLFFFFFMPGISPRK
jgi:hypothetical protein